jgi:acyl-CoA thioester hydrolase
MVVEVDNKIIRLTHEMRNDQTGEIAATTSIVGLYINVVTRRALPLPANVCALGLRLISRQEEIRFS